MSLGRMRMKEGGTWLKASFLACGISLRQRLGIQDTDLSIAIKLRVVNINLNSGMHIIGTLIKRQLLKHLLKLFSLYHTYHMLYLLQLG